MRNTRENSQYMVWWAGPSNIVSANGVPYKLLITCKYNCVNS